MRGRPRKIQPVQETNIHERTMRKCATFEEWRNRHLISGDEAKFKALFEAVKNGQASSQL
jgi:hypothetical protein